jgi:hypothetical protein
MCEPTYFPDWFRLSGRSKIGLDLFSAKETPRATAASSLVLAAIGEHFNTIKSIMGLARDAGLGVIGWKEAHQLYKEFAGGK